MSIPNDETGNALRQIKNDGSDLTKPLEIDFFVAVPSEKIGNSVALDVMSLGFKTSVELDVESGEWTCYCTIKLIPEYLEIVKIEKQLSAIAQLYDSYLDGFGTYGNM